MDPVSHLIGIKTVEDPLHERIRRQPDIHEDGFGALIKPLDMFFQESDTADMDAQAFPYAVAEDEARVEYRDHGLGARIEFAIDRDQDVLIARINLECLRHDAAFSSCSAML